MENNKTALWPIYVDKDTHKIIDTVTKLMRPVETELVNKCKEITKDTESDGLKAFMTETYLTYNNDIIKDNVDFITIACDPKTKEITYYSNPTEKTDNNERISRLIDLIDNACVGKDKNGHANLIMTVISNVVAKYCALNEENKKSFMNVIDFWKNKS